MKQSLKLTLERRHPGAPALRWFCFREEGASRSCLTSRLKLTSNSTFG